MGWNPAKALNKGLSSLNRGRKSALGKAGLRGNGLGAKDKLKKMEDEFDADNKVYRKDKKIKKALRNPDAPSNKGKKARAVQRLAQRQERTGRTSTILSSREGIDVKRAKPSNVMDLQKMEGGYQAKSELELNNAKKELAKKKKAILDKKVLSAARRAAQMRNLR